MFPYWRPWLRDVASRAWRNVRQTAGPILLVAYQTGQLTGTSSARALAAGVLTAVAVTTGRLLVGDLAGWQPSPTSPPWRATATRVVAAAAVPVAAIWPLDWAGFHGVHWGAVGWAAALAAGLSLLDHSSDQLSTVPAVTPDPGYDVEPDADPAADDPTVETDEAVTEPA